MHSKTQRTLMRVERVLRDRIEPAIYSSLSPLEVSAWAVGGEPVDPQIALGLRDGAAVNYEAFPIGASWGAPWDTTWLKFDGVAPEGSIDDLQTVIDLGWADHSVGFQCEGLVYRPDGTIVKALNPKTRWIPLDQVARPGQRFTFYVEAASNPLLLGVPPFQPTILGAKPDTFEEHLYTLRSAQICRYHDNVAQLLADLQVLEGLAHVLQEDTSRRERILLAIDRALNVFDPANLDDTAHQARDLLAPVLSKPANASAHLTSAMGHAHIDSAWLWPVRETERKVARTLANVLELLDTHEDFIFTMSSAQQYVWLEQRYPELFGKLKRQVDAGRIVPVGGMWVEPDGMLPSGESYARQILLGQHYFKKHFGSFCDLMWLPDSFGYSGALPQLAKLGGMDRFLTQKMSWNDSNTFPHHSFWWEGIDGTRVLTHFPPSDTYGAEVTAQELDRAARNYREKAISDNSILLFGYGDGGGGPTREMIARSRLFADLEDAPKVIVRGPHEFFDDLAEDMSGEDVSWSGELYLELHRGTFTSQSDTKVGNRRNEALITQVEAALTRSALAGETYPYEELEHAWELLLLGQFHDILPGTSINWVHTEAVANHREVESTLRGLLASAGLKTSGPATDRAPHGTTPELVIGDNEHVLENEFLRATIDRRGLINSLIDKKSGRDLVPEGRALGELALYRDEPVMWDAWDLEVTAFDTQRVVNEVHEMVAESDDAGAHVRVERRFGKSSAAVTYTLDERPQLDLHLEVEWQEDEKLLKLLFPLAIHANHARFETQFGYVERAIHENTGWDAARFEVCAHRYLHVGEPSFGVGLVNDGAYGYSVGKPAGNQVEIGASVLKSARFPDPKADRGRHTKSWAILPTPEIADVIDAAEEINATCANYINELVTVDDESRSVRVSAVKMAHDRSGDVVVRLYESLGNRTRARVKLGDMFASPQTSVVNLMEEEIYGTVLEVSGNDVLVDLHPFEILTLRVKVQ